MQKIEIEPGAQLDPHSWVSNHADYLYVFAMKRTRDEELAKDLVQDTFLSALVKVDDFRGKSTERTWLTAILKNKIMDAYRKRASGLGENIGNSGYETDPDDFFDRESGHWKAEYQPMSIGMEDKGTLLNKELGQILESCLKKLPSLWFSVFAMKHVDGEDTEMICSELRVTSSNFWVIMHRAKVSLRACVQKYWGGL